MAPAVTDESAKVLWVEQAVNTAGYIGAVAYGLHIAAYAAAGYFLLQGSGSRRRRWALHLFNTLVFALGSVRMATTIRFHQEAWVLYRDSYPGGPPAYLLQEQSSTIPLLGFCAAILGNVFLMILAMWRAYIVWDTWKVLILPAALFIASIVFTTADIIHLRHPIAGHWGPNISIACWSLSAATIIVLAALIVTRILYHQYRQRRLVSSGVKAASEISSTSAATLIVESTLPVAVFFFFFVVLYARQDSTEDLLLPCMLQVVCIAEHLIIIQVYRGRLWTRDDTAKLSSLQFRRDNEVVTGSLGSSVTNPSGDQDMLPGGCGSDGHSHPSEVELKNSDKEVAVPS